MLIGTSKARRWRHDLKQNCLHEKRSGSRHERGRTAFLSSHRIGFDRGALGTGRRTNAFRPHLYDCVPMSGRQVWGVVHVLLESTSVDYDGVSDTINDHTERVAVVATKYE